MSIKLGVPDKHGFFNVEIICPLCGFIDETRDNERKYWEDRIKTYTERECKQCIDMQYHHGVVYNWVKTIITNERAKNVK